MSNFDQAAVLGMVDKVTSHAASLGIFRRVNTHEPKAAPGSGLTYAVWADVIEPLDGSGLASTSGYVVLNGRIFGNMLQKPEDEIDPRIITSVVTLIGAYSADFDFGATVRAVDLLGMYGQKLGAKAGYVTIAGGMYRVMTITIPVIVNDMWSQVG